MAFRLSGYEKQLQKSNDEIISIRRNMFGVEYEPFDQADYEAWVKQETTVHMVQIREKMAERARKREIKETNSNIIIDAVKKYMSTARSDGYIPRTDEQIEATIAHMLTSDEFKKGINEEGFGKKLVESPDLPEFVDKMENMNLKDYQYRGVFLKNEDVSNMLKNAGVVLPSTLTPTKDPHISTSFQHEASANITDIGTPVTVRIHEVRIKKDFAAAAKVSISTDNENINNEIKATENERTLHITLGLADGVMAQESAKLFDKEFDNDEKTRKNIENLIFRGSLDKILKPNRENRIMTEYDIGPYKLSYYGGELADIDINGVNYSETEEYESFYEQAIDDCNYGIPVPDDLLDKIVDEVVKTIPIEKLNDDLGKVVFEQPVEIKGSYGGFVKDTLTADILSPNEKALTGLIEQAVKAGILKDGPVITKEIGDPPLDQKYGTDVSHLLTHDTSEPVVMRTVNHNSPSLCSDDIDEISANKDYDVEQGV